MPIRIAFYDAFALFEGSGRAMLDVIDRLDPGRFEPVVVCPRQGDLLGAASARGYEVDVVEPPGRLKSYNKVLLSGWPGVLPATAFSLLGYGLRMSRWLRRHRIDLLHCNQTRAALQAGESRRRLGLAPVPEAGRARRVETERAGIRLRFQLHH